MTCTHLGLRKVWAGDRPPGEAQPRSRGPKNRQRLAISRHTQVFWGAETLQAFNMQDGPLIARDQEVRLGELLTDAWNARWTITIVICCLTLLGAIASLLIEKKYRAEILIAPVTDSPTGAVGGLGGLASQYGELASLAGLSLSGRSASNKEESIAVLQSQLITEAYVRDNDLLPVLYPKLWDASANKWRESDPKKIPTLWTANQYFKRIREVKQDKQTGLVTVRITWHDPAVAAKWANELVRNTNRYLRNKAIKESEQNIAYLNQEAATTNIIEAKAAIYSILKDEVNKQMIAKGREEYALKVLDPAQAPESPSTPSRFLMLAAGFAAGLLVSGLIVLSRSRLFRSRLD